MNKHFSHFILHENIDYDVDIKPINDFFNGNVINTEKLPDYRDIYLIFINCEKTEFDKVYFYTLGFFTAKNMKFFYY